MPAICFDITPQRRHFERHAVGDDRDGAVIDARRVRGELGLGSETHHLFRQRRRCDIDLANRATDDGVANCAADDARLGVSGLESGEDLADRRRMKPVATDAWCSDKGFRHGLWLRGFWVRRT